MVKIRCISKVGYNDIKLKRFVDYNDEIEVDEERATYLVETRGLCERIEEDKPEGNKEDNLDDSPEENPEGNDEKNLDDKTSENIDDNKSDKKGKK